MARLQRVKHRKRGVTWGNGEPAYCVLCGRDRTRRRRATYSAEWVFPGGGILPVSYCDDHFAERGGSEEVA